MNIFGTSGNDTLIGTQFADRIFGRAGNDRLDGFAGDDSLDGGSGRDTLNGYSGNDTLFGGPDFGFERDYLYGGADDDLIYAAGDYAYGHSGNDTIELLTGGNRASGGSGNDILIGVDLYKDDGTGVRPGLEFVNLETNYMYGGLDNDWLIGGNSTEYMSGGSGNDILISGGSGGYFGAGGDTLSGGSGNDTLIGEDWQPLEEFHGGSGHDYIDMKKGAYKEAWGGSGNDIIRVGTSHGNDVYGEDGNDVIYLDGTDYLSLPARLYGGKGDDIFNISMASVFTIHGGEDDDIFRFIYRTPENDASFRSARGEIRDFSDGDLIDLSYARDNAGGSIDASDLDWVSLWGGPAFVMPEEFLSDGRARTLLKFNDRTLQVYSDEVLRIDDFIF